MLRYETMHEIIADFKGISPIELVLWQKPKATGAVVSIIAMILLVFGFLNYTLVTFICRLIQISIVSCGVLVKLNHLTYSNESVVQATSAAITHAAPFVTDMIAEAASIMMWDNTTKTLKVVGVSILVGFLGNLFSDLTLVFLVSVGAFVIPKAYLMNKEQADAYIVQLQQRLGGAITAVPSASAAKKSQ